MEDVCYGPRRATLLTAFRSICADTGADASVSGADAFVSGSSEARGDASYR
jgi:hypothetical protein